MKYVYIYRLNTKIRLFSLEAPNKQGFTGNFAVAWDQVSWWGKWENHRRARASPFLHRLLLENLCKRTGEERRVQNLCDKRDNNFV